MVLDDIHITHLPVVNTASCTILREALCASSPAYKERQQYCTSRLTPLPASLNVEVVDEGQVRKID